MVGKKSVSTSNVDSVKEVDNCFVNDKLWVGSLEKYEKLDTISDDIIYVVTDDTIQNNIIMDSKVSDKTTYSSRKLESLVSGLVGRLNEFFTIFRLKTFMKTKEFRSLCTTLSFPGSESIKLPVGATDTVYVASENGYVVLKQAVILTTCFIGLENLTTGISTSAYNNQETNRLASTYLPVRKGDKFKIEYTNEATSYCLDFVYADGDL